MLGTFSLFCLEEVCGLLITDAVTKEASPLLSLAAVQIFTFLVYFPLRTDGGQDEKQRYG